MSNYRRDLTSSFAKCARAERQISALDVMIQEFFDDPYRQPRMKADLESASGYHILRIKSFPDVGSFLIDAGIAVGEIIHNLRSALDHVAWQLACEFADGVPAKPKDVSFPICDVRPGNLHKAPNFLDPSDWAVLHEFEPCRGVNGRPDSWSGDYMHQLSQLHEMWNQDKHMMLSVVLMTSNCFSLIPTRKSLPPWIVKTGDSVEFMPERMNEPDPDAEQFDFSHSDKVVGVGAEVGRIMCPSWGGYPEVPDAGFVIPRVALEGFRPLTPSLERLAGYVHDVASSAVFLAEVG